jgi:hypothetical protein
MKRNRYPSLAFAAVMALGLLAAGLAMADGMTCPGYTPSPGSAIVTTRIWNDCPGSDLSVINSYPSLISISDADDGCTGTNLHNWSFSEDGITRAAFENCSHYRYSAVVKFNAVQGEAGLMLAPWWNMWWGGPPADGKFMINAGGEIACFGGRLPFYSFTVAYGLHYTPGEAIWMQITYDPNELEETDPALPTAPNAATIQYQLYYHGVGYSSPLLPFDKANVAEAAEHGLWGELYYANVGGYMQAPNGNKGAAYTANVRFENITFEGPSATPAKTSSWGQVKSLYR